MKVSFCFETKQEKPMKICPKCQETYPDDSLNFCLQDGAVLTQAESLNKALPETVMFNQPRSTSPNQGFGQTAGQQNWGTVPQYKTYPKKSSNTWLWVVGIFGILILVCGGGFIGFIALLSSNYDEPEWNSNFGANVRNTNSTNLSDGRNNVTKIDISKWNKNFSVYGDSDFEGGELIMNSKKNGFYFVLVAPAAYKTVNATTTVTVRNIRNGENSLGYGLIFHSDPKPLQQGYAFLIDSKNQKYRIVTHKPQKEDEILGWTNSPAIKSGAQKNVLAVQDQDSSVNFFINGEFVTSIRNTEGFSQGVAGLYVGGMSPVGFSDLEIRK